MKKTFSPWEVLGESYAIVRSNFWKIIGSYALLVVFFLASDIVLGKILLIEIIISALFAFCSVLFALAYIKGKPFSLDAILLKLSWRKFFWYLLAYVVAGLAIFGGSLLLIVPGIIVAVQLRMVKFIAFEKDVKPREALRLSVQMTKGHRTSVFQYMVISLVMNVAGALCLFVGLFFTLPLTIIGLGLIYKKLSANVQPQTASQTAPVVEAEIVDSAVV